MKFDRVKFIGLRMTKGLSQSDMAEGVDVSRPTIAAWEKGTSEPKLQQINKAADIFGVQPEELIVKGGETA